VTKDGMPVAGGTIRIRSASPTRPDGARLPAHAQHRRHGEGLSGEGASPESTGVAVIDCGVTAEGDLYECALASETPTNYDLRGRGLVSGAALQARTSHEERRARTKRRQHPDQVRQPELILAVRGGRRARTGRGLTAKLVAEMGV
jgi:hypothetical protein